MLVLFTLSGCAEKGEEKAGNNATPSLATTPAEEQVYPIGEAGRTDKLEIMITGAADIEPGKRLGANIKNQHSLSMLHH
jgi:hypothetical protein